MMVPHSKSIRFPRTFRRNPFCADTGKIRRKFPYIECNYKTERELYEWDHSNRLTSVTQQEFNAETQEWTTVQIVEYTYDYNNVWIRKINGSDKTIFIPENYQTVAQIDNGAVTHHYLWTPNQQDKLLADTTSSEILWSLTDHLGTIRDIIQSTTTGIVTQAHIIYDAYGNIISCTDSTGQPISTPLLFAYTGKAFDTSTSLQNNINRWYDPTTGRWLSTDPIGFEGNDSNLFRYVHNNPVCAVDFNGFIEKAEKSKLKTPSVFPLQNEKFRELTIEEQEELIHQNMDALIASIQSVNADCENKIKCLSIQKLRQKLSFLPFIGELEGTLQILQGDVSGTVALAPAATKPISKIGSSILSKVNILTTLNSIQKINREIRDVESGCEKILDFLESELIRYHAAYKALASGQL